MKFLEIITDKIIGAIVTVLLIIIINPMLPSLQHWMFTHRFSNWCVIYNPIYITLFVLCFLLLMILISKGFDFNKIKKKFKLNIKSILITILILLLFKTLTVSCKSSNIAILDTPHCQNKYAREIGKEVRNDIKLHFDSIGYTLDNEDFSFISLQPNCCTILDEQTIILHYTCYTFNQAYDFYPAYNRKFLGERLSLSFSDTLNYSKDEGIPKSFLKKLEIPVRLFYILYNDIAEAKPDKDSKDVETFRALLHEVLNNSEEYGLDKEEVLMFDAYYLLSVCQNDIIKKIGYKLEDLCFKDNLELMKKVSKDRSIMSEYSSAIKSLELSKEKDLSTYMSIDFCVLCYLYFESNGYRYNDINNSQYDQNLFNHFQSLMSHLNIVDMDDLSPFMRTLIKDSNEFIINLIY